MADSGRRSLKAKVAPSSIKSAGVPSFVSRSCVSVSLRLLFVPEDLTASTISSALLPGSPLMGTVTTPPGLPVPGAVPSQ